MSGGIPEIVILLALAPKILKFLELTQRTHIRDYVTTHDPPDVILTDGQPLVNSAAWAVAHFYKCDLRDDDEELYQALRYLTGEEMIPLREFLRFLRKAWPLALLNILGLGRFKYPEMIFLLDLEPAAAMARIRARGTSLQEHEFESFLDELGRGYEHVCTLLHERRGIPLTRVRVDQVPLDEVVQIVADGVLEKISAKINNMTTDQHQLGTIDVLATTMSGSIQDQRNVRRIGPEFKSRTSRQVSVHLADSHAEAQEIARQADVEHHHAEIRFLDGGERRSAAVGGLAGDAGGRECLPDRLSEEPLVVDDEHARHSLGHFPPSRALSGAHRMKRDRSSSSRIAS